MSSMSNTMSSSSSMSASMTSASSSSTHVPSGGTTAVKHKRLLSPYGIMGIALGATVALLAAAAILIPWRRRRQGARGQDIAELKINLDEETSTLSGGDALTYQYPDGSATSLPGVTSNTHGPRENADTLNPDLLPTPFMEQGADGGVSHPPARPGKSKLKLDLIDQPTASQSPPLPHQDRPQPTLPTAGIERARQEMDGGVRLAGGHPDEAEIEGTHTMGSRLLYLHHTVGINRHSCNGKGVFS